MLPQFEFRLFGEYKGRRVEIPFVGQALLDFSRDIGDYQPAFRLIAEDLSEMVMEQFQTEGARSEVTWQDLAPSTVKQRGSDHPILVRDGMLKGSFQEGGPGHHEQISEKQLLWGSDVRYALFMQTGTGAGFEQDRLPPASKGARAAARRAEVSGQSLFSFAKGRGMARRKIISIGEAGQTDIGSTLRARILQVGRQYGFGTQRGLTPLEARKIGQQMLRG